MFASKRATVQTYTYALGVTASGARTTLAPRVLGTGEVLQALRVIERAAGGGMPEMTRLCRSIAARVATDGEFRDVIAVRIVTGTHDAVEYLARGKVGTE